MILSVPRIEAIWDAIQEGRSEARNSKQIQIPNGPMLETGRRALVLVISLFVLGICFVLRIWDFGFRTSVGSGSVKMCSPPKPPTWRPSSLDCYSQESLTPEGVM